MSMSEVSKMTAAKLAWQTADAYSADLWGAVKWVAAAQMLLDMNFEEWQVRAILRSKITRWARDGWGEESTWLGQLFNLADKYRKDIQSGEYGEGEIMQEATQCPA